MTPFYDTFLARETERHMETNDELEAASVEEFNRLIALSATDPAQAIADCAAILMAGGVSAQEIIEDMALDSDEFDLGAFKTTRSN